MLLLVCFLGFFGVCVFFCLFDFLLEDTTINWVQIWDSLNPICSTVM